MQQLKLVGDMPDGRVEVLIGDGHIVIDLFDNDGGIRRGAIVVDTKTGTVDIRDRRDGKRMGAVQCGEMVTSLL